MSSHYLVLVVVYPCGYCAIGNIKRKLQAEKDSVVIKDLLNEPSVDNIIEHLQQGERLVICSCEGGAKDCLQKVLDRRKSSPEEYKFWEKLLYVTDQLDDNHSTDNTVNRIPCSNMVEDHDEIVKKILYELRWSGSSRGSTVSSTVAIQQQQMLHQVLDYQNELDAKITQTNETAHVIGKSCMHKMLLSLSISYSKRITRYKRTD